MIEKLLPAPIITVVATPEMWTQACYPDEMALVKNAVSSRRHEFQAGRNCARQALAMIGIDHHPVLSGSKREPIWPKGIIGSITHCQHYCAVTVCKSTDAKAIGIDVEKKTALEKDSIDLICTQKEQAWLNRHGFMNTFWSKVIFSAKESLYKCYYPLTHQYLDFLDAELNLNPDDNTFKATLRVNPPAALSLNSPIKGRFLIEKGFIFTALIL